jgi:hypothetical protein
MRRSMLAVSVLSFAMCLTESAAAQILDLPRGTRVRVTTSTTSQKPLVGAVDTVRGDTLFWKRNPDGLRPVPLALVSRLEISRSRKRPMWSKTAPLWLTGAGAGVGAFVGYATTPKDDFFGPDFGAAVVGSLGGILGLAVGTGLAIGVKSDEWESVLEPASRQRASIVPSVYLAPASRGMTVGLRAAF